MVLFCLAVSFFLVLVECHSREATVLQSFQYPIHWATNTHTQTHIHSHLHTYIHTHKPHTGTHTHTHTHTHQHTPHTALLRAVGSMQKFSSVVEACGWFCFVYGWSVTEAIRCSFLCNHRFSDDHKSFSQKGVACFGCARARLHGGCTLRSINTA